MADISYGLNGKVVLVTGGTKGIGLELARNFLIEKATVIICSRKEENLRSAAEELKGGDNLMTLQAHVAKEADVENMFRAVQERFSRLDILINNVGMNLFTPSVTDSEPSLWQKIVDSNLSGAYLCSRKAAAMMKEKKSGKIINITSIAARKASPGMGIYGVAKAGIEMLTRVLAAELAQFNIQVNAVSPSMVRTDFSKLFWSNKDIHDHIVKSVPMGRIAEIIDVIHPVLFLSSSGADYITGQTLVVDGGATVV